MCVSREFKGVWIPREIWLAEDLSIQEKFLLVEIESLSRVGECYATNQYFAEFMGLSKDRISRIISALKEKGYIELELFYKDNSKQIDKRIITTKGLKGKMYGHPENYPTPPVENYPTPIGESDYTTIGENTKENNTSFNNTKKKRKKEEKTYDEIISEYTANEEVRDAILEYIKVRSKMKNYLTNYALRRILKELEEFSGGDDLKKIDILDYSIMAGYPKLYPSKDNKKNTVIPTETTKLEEEFY